MGRRRFDDQIDRDLRLYPWACVPKLGTATASVGLPRTRLTELEKISDVMLDELPWLLMLSSYRKARRTFSASLKKIDANIRRRHNCLATIDLVFVNVAKRSMTRRSRALWPVRLLRLKLVRTVAGR